MMGSLGLQQRVVRTAEHCLPTQHISKTLTRCSGCAELARTGQPRRQSRSHSISRSPLGLTRALGWLFTLGLLQISRSMYICLTVWTGAVPAEYFSVKKRPAYKEYQATTNMFFPWFPKPESQAKDDDQNRSDDTRPRPTATKKRATRSPSPAKRRSNTARSPSPAKRGTSGGARRSARKASAPDAFVPGGRW